jgi:hypothetical protein
VTSVRIDAGLWALLAAAAVFAAVLASPAVIAGGDVYWHIASGRWMIDNQQVLRIDPFSFTYGGQAWEIRSWLADILLALGYVGGGWSGVLILCAAAAAATMAVLGLHLARGLSPSVALVWFALVAAAGAGALVPEPYLLALPCLAVWCAGLCTARAEDRPPSLLLLPAMGIWANLDDSFVVGLALAVVLGAEAVLLASHRLNVLRGWAVFCGLGLLLAFLTPAGPAGLVHALRAIAASTGGPVYSIFPVVLFVPAVAVLLPLVVLKRESHWLLRLAFLAVLFFLALHSEAWRLVLAVIVPFLLTGQLTDLPAFRSRAVAALVLAAIAGATVRLVLPLSRGDDAATPASALAAVPAPLQHTSVLNARDFGGYLIFHGIKPFIDGRPLYSARFRRQYAALADPGLLAQTLTRYHIRWTILSPADPAVRTLDGLAGWNRLYTDQWAVVHVRTGGR